MADLSLGNNIILTGEEAFEQDLPYRSIGSAINTGLLDDVKDSGRFTQLIEDI